MSAEAEYCDIEDIVSILNRLDFTPSDEHPH